MTKAEFLKVLSIMQVSMETVNRVDIAIHNLRRDLEVYQTVHEWIRNGFIWNHVRNPEYEGREPLFFGELMLFFMNDKDDRITKFILHSLPHGHKLIVTGKLISFADYSNGAMYKEPYCTQKYGESIQEFLERAKGFFN